MTTVLLSVGDVSGDLHAAGFVEALRALRPGARFIGLGGCELEKCGVELVVDQRELAVGGIVELVPGLPRIARAWRRLTAALDAERPDLVVLVDSSGFNLPLARRVHRAGIPILYFVSPQVWAWRRGRIRKLAARVDRLAAILPFEPEIYAGTGLEVEFVGHPLVDLLRSDGGPLGRDSARALLGVPRGKAVVALLPGSRRNEIRHCLGVQLAAARLLHARRPECRFLIPLAPSIEPARVEEEMRRAQLPAVFPLELVGAGSRAVLSACDVVVTKPGTATLEAALLDRPCVVAARIQPLSAVLLRRLVRVDYWAMPNLIAGREIVPEFLQEHAEPRAIAAAVEALLAGPARTLQREGLATVSKALGAGGALQRTAAIAEEMLVARDCA
jgi:lipid-A-disaccharide synthase